MKRVVIAVVLVLAAAVGLLYLLGGPGQVFGTKGDDAESADGAGGREVEGRGKDPAAQSGGSDDLDANGKPRGARLFGSPRSQRKGVGSLSARVVRFSDQQPVEAAVLILSGTSNADAAVALRATTDKMGVASFAQVPAGDDYDLRVEPVKDPPAHIPAVAISSGQSKDLGTIYVGQLAALSGRVTDAKGAAIRGADVRVYVGYDSMFDSVRNMMDMFSSLDREPTPLAKVESDAEGRFAFEKLAPGPVVVRARVEGKKQALKAARVGGQATAAAELVLVVEGGAAVAGHVVDAHGKGVPGAHLGIFSESQGDPSDILFGRTFADTGADGAFRAVVEEGATKLRAFVAADGYPTGFTKEFNAGDDDVKIVLTGGVEVFVTILEKDTNQPIPDARIFLVMSDAGDLDGPEGQGGMLVGTTGPAGTASFLSRPGIVEMVMVSHPGHASGMGMPGRGDGMMMPGSLDGDVPKSLTAGETNKVTIRLKRGVTLKGRVLDPQGQGIAGASVTPLDFMGGGAGGTRSAADGAYRLEGVQPESMSMIVVTAPGWVQRDAMGGMKIAMPQDKAPAAGDELKRDFTMYPASTVRGRVVGPDGNPIGGAKVSFAGGSYNPFKDMMGGKGDVFSAADGTYVLFDVDASDAGEGGMATAMMSPPGAPAPESTPPPVPKGSHGRVRASADGYVAGATPDFAVPEGGTGTAPDLVLGRGVALHGKVLDPAGRSIAGAKVEISVQAEGGEQMDAVRDILSGQRQRSAHTGPDGTFDVDTLPNGEITLTVASSSAAATRKTVKIEKGAAPAPVEIRLRPAAQATGRVAGADGKPLAGATVAVEGDLLGASGDDAYVTPASAKTDADGKFALSGLPPGRVTVRVSLKGYRATKVEAQAGGLAVEVALAASSPADAARLAEIQKEILEVSKQMTEAKDDAARKAAQQRMMELYMEQQRLQKEVGGGDLPATPDDLPDAPAPPAPTKEAQPPK